MNKFLEKIDSKILGRPYRSRRGYYYDYPYASENYGSIISLRKYLGSFKGIENYLKLSTAEFLLFEEILKEVVYYKQIEKLKTHPFWTKENNEALILNYLELYEDLFKMIKEYKKGNKSSRNLYVNNKHTCISSFQVINDRLIVYSRSCDLSCGYLADLNTIYNIMLLGNLSYFSWYIGCPHIYENNLDKTIEQFNNKVKVQKMNFNIR